MPRLLSLTLAFFAAGLLGLPATAVAEEFLLANGGRVEGTWLNPEQKPRETYEIQTVVGPVRLAASQVTKVVGPTEREAAYSALLPRMPATADGHWRMAQWCQQNYLEDRRKRHLEQVLEIDPDHVLARRALGFTQQDGRWVLPEVINRQQGLIRHGQRWQLPADLLLQLNNDRRERQQSELLSQMRMWRSWIVKGRGKEEEARQRFLALRDPFAVPGLSDLLKDDEEPAALKSLYIEVLDRIGSDAAAPALIHVALESQVLSLRSRALDVLRRVAREAAIQGFQTQLGSSENYRINRAAVGLAAMDASHSVRPLIDVLVTTHKFKSGGSSGAISPTFTSGPGGGLGGFSMGGKPKVIEKEVANESVRDALVKLTGVNHGFDKAAWEAWMVRSNRPQTFQLRRSE